MSNNYQIAIIGPQATTNGFRALGFTRVIANTPEEALSEINTLRSQKKENGQPIYAVIYILEELATAISEENWKKWSLTALPAITLLPTGLSKQNIAITRMKKIVERAVGSDILN